MDSSCLWAVLSFAIGMAAGFQGIYERYGGDSLRASFTISGLTYLITRGMLPAGIFVLLTTRKLVSEDPWLWALALGTGTELVLRSQIYVRQQPEEKSQFTELLRGPLDLLRWYQNLFLEGSANTLARKRKEFLQDNIPKDVPFRQLCERALLNREAWEDPVVAGRIREAVDELLGSFEGDLRLTQDPEGLDLDYRMKLGYRLRREVGEKGFGTLVSAKAES